MSRAPYDEAATARRLPEPAKAAAARRSEFQRDRARVLHSAAFRRLAGKTQVVGVGEYDVPRTRLTHSLECAQIGRELAVALGADADLVDAACLAHDLGHPPFGHNGEIALDAGAAGVGGFEGNAQSFRVLVRLEPKTPGGGLNLTRATLDATAKYPWPRRPDTPKYGVYADDLAAFEWVREGVSDGARCLEATIMDWADDVAYSVHDLEDGIVAGQVDPARLPELRAEVVKETATRYSDAAGLEEAYDRLLAQPWFLTRHDPVALKRTTSELIGRFCVAAVTATRERYGPEPLARYGAVLVVPDGIRAECALLKGVTAFLVMSRPDLLARQERERAVVAELVERGGPDRRAAVDRIASMTDAAALRAYEGLTRIKRVL